MTKRSRQTGLVLLLWWVSVLQLTFPDCVRRRKARRRSTLNSKITRGVPRSVSPAMTRRRDALSRSLIGRWQARRLSMPKACKEMTEKEMKSRRSLNLRRNDMHLQPLVCLCTMNPRPSQRLRYQFLASLPHLDVFDVSKCGCEPYDLTHSLAQAQC